MRPTRSRPGKRAGPIGYPGAAEGIEYGEFIFAGVGDTDGVHYLPVAVSPRYPLGLLVVQNGEAPEPDDTQPINGFEFDGATQFKYIDFRDTLKALLP